MTVPKEVSEYMATLARKGNKMRSKEDYQKAAKKGWRQRKKKSMHRVDVDDARGE